MAQQIIDLGDNPRFDQVEPIANELIQRFEDGEISAVNVAYMRFFSASKQVPEIMQLLPLKPPEEADASEDEASGSGRGFATEYDFSPDPEALLGELLPASVRMRLFQCFTDAVVS